jgi:hypothetical protein
MTFTIDKTVYGQLLAQSQRVYLIQVVVETAATESKPAYAGSRIFSKHQT